MKLVFPDFLECGEQDILNEITLVLKRNHSTLGQPLKPRPKPGIEPLGRSLVADGDLGKKAAVIWSERFHRNQTG